MLLSTQQAVPPRLIVLSLNSRHQPSYWSGDIKQIHLKVHPMARMEKQYEGINLNVASLFRVQTKKKSASWYLLLFLCPLQTQHCIIKSIWILKACCASFWKEKANTSLNWIYNWFAEKVSLCCLSELEFGHFLSRTCYCVSLRKTAE